MERAKWVVLRPELELGGLEKCAQIRVVAILRVLQPRSGRSGRRPLKRLRRPEAAGERMPDADRRVRFCELFRNGPGDGATRLSGIIGRGRAALDGTFLRRHCGTEVLRNDQVRRQRSVSDVNSVQKRHFLRSEFGK